MANMSYCRFRNTQQDVEECLDALRHNEELSKEEARSAERMFLNILQFLVDYDIIDDYDPCCLGNVLNNENDEEDIK